MSNTEITYAEMRLHLSPGAKLVHRQKCDYLIKTRRKNIQNRLLNNCKIKHNRILYLFCLSLDKANEDEVEDFKMEINFMKTIGLHENVVTMLGCCTLYPPLCLVVEYVPHGDLLHYLRDLRKAVMTRHSFPREPYSSRARRRKIMCGCCKACCTLWDFRAKATTNQRQQKNNLLTLPRSSVSRNILNSITDVARA